MFSSYATKILPFFKQFRNLSSGLILDTKSVTKKQALKTLESKKVSKKKPRKRKVLVKKVSDDIEAIWLENLNSENLALYRKTSYGSFRKINSKKLLKRLQQVFPAQLEGVEISPAKPKVKTKESEEKELPSEEQASTIETKSQSVNGEPFMSQYLINHLIEFPMLKTDCRSAAFDAINQDNEDFGDIDVVKFPSISLILNETMSIAARKKLKLWKERMIAEMGFEEFQKFQRDTLSQGTKLHSTLKTYLEVADKSLVKIEPEIEGCWKSLENFLPELYDVRFVEESIYHPFLLYKGILDCVASYRGNPCLIEWKRSSKKRTELSHTYDAPVQASAYLGALPWNKNLEIKNAIVVVAYTDGSPADVHDMTLESCEVYWKEWLRRVQAYWWKKSSLLQQKTEM